MKNIQIAKLILGVGDATLMMIDVFGDRYGMTAYILIPVPLLVSTVSLAHTQMGIKQSVTTNNKGQTTSTNIKIKNDKTSITALQGGMIELINNPSQLKIKYCYENNTCYAFKLEQNGTLIKGVDK